MHAYVPSMANVNWPAFQSALCPPCKFTSDKMVLLEGSYFILGSEDMTLLPLSVYKYIYAHL